MHIYVYISAYVFVLLEKSKSALLSLQTFLNNLLTRIRFKGETFP